MAVSGGATTSGAGGGHATRFLLGTSGGDLLGVTSSVPPGGAGKGGDEPGDGLMIEEGLAIGLEAYTSDDDEEDGGFDQDNEKD